ncbi:carboxylase [Arthrobacter sp. Hiyo8]|nr:carboxylase [Arthrobacter sp. Hiyo8]
MHNGDHVEAGDVLLAVEAMKMEHQLVAAVSGTVHLSSKTGTSSRLTKSSPPSTWRRSPPQKSQQKTRKTRKSSHGKF